MKLWSKRYLYRYTFFISMAIVVSIAYVVQKGTFQAEEIILASMAALIPTLVFSWKLSHYHISSYQNAKICALLGLIYGTGFIVITYVSPYYLDIRLPVISLKLGFIVIALYIFVVPGLFARYFANRSRFNKNKNINIGDAGLVSIILLAGIAIYASLATSAYTDVRKSEEVSEAVRKIKLAYIEKLASDETSAPDDIRLTDLDLIDYDLDENEQIDVEQTDRSDAFTYERHIALTPRQIIITFGPGFDGFSEKTLIVEIEELSKDSERWGCKGGTLSDKYRPSICRNDNN